MNNFMVTNCILKAPLILISITGNALVLAAILRTPPLRSPSTVFLCSLAVSDLLVGLVVQPIYITRRIIWPGLSLLHAENTFSVLACGVSLFTTSAISVDRFMSLHYHLRYPTLMTTKLAISTSVTLWLISILLSCVSFWDMNNYFLTIAVGGCVCLLISTFSYIQIYRIVRRHQLQIHAQQQAVQSLNTEHNLNMMRSKRNAINTFIYYILMIVCYSPMFISSSIAAISKEDREMEWGLADTLAFMNSAINPFLYCWRIRALRVAVLKILRRIVCNHTEES